MAFFMHKRSTFLDAFLDNLSLLKEALSRGNEVGLMECRDKDEGMPHAVLCVIQPGPTDGTKEITAVANMYLGDMDLILSPPTEVDGVKRRDKWRAFLERYVGYANRMCAKLGYQPVIVREDESKRTPAECPVCLRQGCHTVTDRGFGDYYVLLSNRCDCGATWTDKFAHVETSCVHKPHK